MLSNGNQSQNIIQRFRNAATGNDVIDLFLYSLSIPRDYPLRKAMAGKPVWMTSNDN